MGKEIIREVTIEVMKQAEKGQANVPVRNTPTSSGGLETLLGLAVLVILFLLAALSNHR